MGKYFVLQVGHISYNFDWGTNFISGLLDQEDLLCIKCSGKGFHSSDLTTVIFAYFYGAPRSIELRVLALLLLQLMEEEEEYIWTTATTQYLLFDSEVDFTIYCAVTISIRLYFLSFEHSAVGLFQDNCNFLLQHQMHIVISNKITSYLSGHFYLVM